LGKYQFTNLDTHCVHDRDRYEALYLILIQTRAVGAIWLGRLWRVRGRVRREVRAGVVLWRAGVARGALSLEAFERVGPPASSQDADGSFGILAAYVTIAANRQSIAVEQSGDSDVVASVRDSVSLGLTHAAGPIRRGRDAQKIDVPLVAGGVDASATVAGDAGQ
jgi:hypothetical protein